MINEQPTTYTVRNIGTIRWIDSRTGQVGAFTNARVYGVVDSKDRVLSMNGDVPSSWDRKSIAQMIADTHTDLPGAVWIETLEG